MDVDTQAYQAHSLDTSDADAVAVFVARYGCQPERIIRRTNYIAVGPIPEVRDGN